MCIVIPFCHLYFNVINSGHVTNSHSEVGLIIGFIVLLFLLLGLTIVFISMIVFSLKIKTKLMLELKREKDKNIIYDVIDVVGSTHDQVPQAAGMDTAVNIAYTCTQQQ